MNAALHPMSRPLTLRHAARMPLMPATRPLSSISRVAARPMSTPPTAADIGVKSAIFLPSLFQRRPARKSKHVESYQVHKRHDHEQAPPARIAGLREQLPKRDDKDQPEDQHVNGTYSIHIKAVVHHRVPPHSIHPTPEQDR